MSLKCSFVGCSSFELARADQIAFYQDVNTGGWNLALGPEFKITQTKLPPNIGLVDTGDPRFPYNVICKICHKKIGKVNSICGFETPTINFSGKKVILKSSYGFSAKQSSWGKIISSFPQIRKITASIPQDSAPVGSNTVHFHNGSDLQDMIDAGNAVASRSGLSPRRYQWRAFFFACFQNTLLCLPTGMGKTLIANLLMKAYKQRNPDKGQVFIVPTVVLVDQQADVIERNCGLKVIRRSSDHNKEQSWLERDIVVCTHAMLVNAIKMKQIDISQLSLLILDEVHEANSPSSIYGLLLPYIKKCSPSQRPRVLALTASPSGANSTDMRQTISSLCDKLGALPFTPLVDDEKNTDTANNVSCHYISIHQTSFEVKFEDFVMEILDSLSKFHKFFNGNWKISVNVSIKLKINDALKVLSHASLVAQNTNDLMLRQLTQWMNKWIDSLDILEIFGPRKLLEYIRADLDFAEKNDALSKLVTQVGLFLITTRLSINRMEHEYDIAADSPRVTELLKHLMCHKSDSERILIFVERRNTAERLSRRLKEDPDISSMNPDFVVGNSQSGFTKEMQHKILQNFHDGECQVLVATSVLEQGIDVAACGVVICFDGVKSMKSIIQTRGRARKKAASFIAFVSADKKRKVNELTTMETSMNYAIRQLMQEYKSNFNPQVTELIEKFLDSDRESVEGMLDVNEDEDEIEDEPIDEIELPDDKTLLHLRFFNFADSAALRDHIGSFFKTPQFDRFISINKNFITAQFATSTVNTNEATDMIKKISTAADRKTAKSLSTWMEWINLSEATERNLHSIIKFDSLCGFHFSSWLTVKYDNNPIWSDGFELKIRKNKIILLKGTHEFWIHPIDVDGYILINDTSSSFEIFFCLRNPPTYFIEKEIAPFDFNTRSFNLYIRRNCPVSSSDSWTIRDELQYFALAVYNVCNLKLDTSDYGPILDTIEIKKSERFKREYLIKAWQSKYAAVLPPVVPKNVLLKFQKCSSIATLEILLDNTVPVRFNPLHVQSMKEVDLPFAECDPPSNYSMFARIKITPWRVIFMPMQPLQKNRVFRYFPNSENFLLISFTDEHDGNPWRSKQVYNWFLQVLVKGIDVGGKCFTFLGCSSSQLREGHCWFSCLDRQDVYNHIGEFPDTMTAGRKLTRLAMAFASSIPTVPLDHGHYLKTVAPDVESNGVTFSDGIGCASPELFKKIKTILNLPQKVSAFQIRIGGIKGVISLHDQMAEGKEVMFRKSMKKFESSHNMLEVLNYSFSIPLFLNRHVILLLSSFGVPDEVFLDLQHNDLVKYMEALTEDDKALSFVKSNSTIFDWDLLPTDQVAQEPFFRQMLISNTVQLISGIIKHAHIFLPKGRVLMGVLDETNTLEYGEVYAHIVEDGVDIELECKVVVFRNPCVLPSDIRVLFARSRTRCNSKLRDLYQNCLVLPAKGRNSHAQECSGGDLDGDLYYVIWDERVIPPKLSPPGLKVVKVETIEVAAKASHYDMMELLDDYDSTDYLGTIEDIDIDVADYSDDDFKGSFLNQQHVETREHAPKASESSHYEMMQFFCDYVFKNQLGIIANAHLAISDKFGSCHPQSIQLARYVTAETDAPRKGWTVGKIDPKLMPAEYPDFMEKSDKPSYRSQTILGELFRQSHPLLEVLLEKKIILSPQQKFDFTCDNDTVDGHYTRYSFEIKKLLQSFELDSEEDLFSGTPQWNNSYMSQFKKQNQLRKTVNENVAEFWRKWQNIFEEWRSKISDDQEKILEWYYQPNSQKTPVFSFSFLAMPFVDFEKNARNSITEKIQVATLRWVIHNKMNWLNEWRHRYHVGQAIMQRLDGIECHFYGSSMLGLFEEYSDLDLYADDTNSLNLCEILKDIDKDVINIKKPHACVRLSYDLLPVDVSNFVRGVEKTYALAEAFDKKPGLWPALRVLIEWARTVRIVKSGGSQGLMTVVSFCHLFIYFASSSAPRKTSNQKEYALQRIVTWMESVRDSQCGELIHDFLKFLSNRKNQSWIVVKTDPWTNEPLIRSGLIDELRKNAEIAVYILAVHDGDINKLFQFCTKNRLFRIDKRYLKPNSVTEGKKQHCLNEIKTKCNPRKCRDLTFELVDRNGVFYLEVTGDHKYFQDVERGLNKIHNKIISSRISGFHCHTFHIKDSTMILPEHGSGPSTEVSFSTYQGENFMAQHTSIWKSVLTFRNNHKNLNWQTTEYQRYEKQFLKQMKLYKENQKMAVRGSRTWRFFSDMSCNIRCGNHYLFNVPETLMNTFETITVAQVERSVSKYEEALGLEKQENIIQNLKNYNSLTLLRSQQALVDQAPLELIPLKDMKKRLAKQKKDETVTSKPIKSKSNGINHSFYPQWIHGKNQAKEFANKYGFKQVPLVEDDYYTNISVYWRQRELVVSCDFKGIITNIRHRSTRWLSATIKRFEQKGGDDVRTYLECRAPLDDDESCLETIIEYLNGRSVFEASFSTQIKQNYTNRGHSDETLSARPLITEMFHLNLRFRSMRLITPVAKFVNTDNDILLLHDVNDGIFRLETREFEWFPKHYEFEIRMCVDKRNDLELSKKSFDMSLLLFDFTKNIKL